jgi:hypothetical protein
MGSSRSSLEQHEPTRLRTFEALWKERPNQLSAEQNEQLRTSLDYSALADYGLSSLGM